jgi:hypothetical protein
MVKLTLADACECSPQSRAPTWWMIRNPRFGRSALDRLRTQAFRQVTMGMNKRLMLVSKFSC